ncbi:hypothetical protein ACTG9Q_00405 [Actinokineospora sp. 24-640]
MTDTPSTLPAIIGITAIIAIVGAVIAIVVLHGGGESGVAVPAPQQTTAPPGAIDIDNQAARLSYRVPQSWTPMPDAAPEVLGVEFTGAASFGLYPCGGAEYSRAFAVSAAVQSSGNAELSPRATAERFAAEFAATYFTGARPGTVEAGTAEIDGHAAVLVTLPLEIDAEDPLCQATGGLISVVAVDLDNAASADKPGVAMLVIVSDSEGGPDEPAPLPEDDIRSVIASVRVR